jgi:protein subunit release factor B
MEYRHIPSSDEDLLNECEVETFRASGHGGQNVNRRETAVRLRHLPTGVETTCQQERRQYRNIQAAAAQLRRKLEDMLRKRHRKRRVATQTPRAVRERILDSKKRTARKKKLRKNPSPDDY